VVHSLSIEGVFLECGEAAQLGSRVGVVVPLSDPDPRAIRCSATVLYHHRRSSTGANGFGLRFADPETGLRNRIDRFLDSYGGPIPTDRTGSIAWPVEVPHIDPGWHPLVWSNLDPSASAGEAARGPAEQRLGSLVTRIEEVSGGAERGAGERIAFHFLRKALAPAAGIPKEWLLQPPLKRALAAQMLAAEALDAAAWRLIDLSCEQTATIRAARDALERAHAELRAPSALQTAGRAGASVAEAWATLGFGLGQVSGFLALLCANLGGLAALEEAADETHPAQSV